MTDHDALPPDGATDSLAVARRDLSDAHADLQHVQSVVLREGPRAKKTARYMAVRNRHTGEVHHHALTLETGRKKQGSWELDDKRSISFSDEDEDEIARLLDFLRQMRGETVPAATAASPAPAARLLEQLSALSRDVDSLKTVVRAVRDQAEAFKGLSAAIAFGRYAQVLERLKKLIASNASIQELRELLAEHPWLTGSEYSEPLAAEELEDDAFLRRTPAGRLEALMVRSPQAPLFEGDVPGPELSQALWQAMRLREVVAPAGPVTLTLVMGHDGDEARQDALQRLNAHLNGIEVLTYDQMLRSGQRVLDVLRATAKGPKVV